MGAGGQGRGSLNKLRKQDAVITGCAPRPLSPRPPAARGAGAQPLPPPAPLHQPGGVCAELLPPVSEAPSATEMLLQDPNNQQGRGPWSWGRQIVTALTPKVWCPGFGSSP